MAVGNEKQTYCWMGRRQRAAKAMTSAIAGASGKP
jgi:hypothetical protein